MSEKEIKVEILPGLILKELDKGERRRIYVLLYQRFYHRLPEMKLYMKNYHAVPKNKARAKELRTTPEGLARIRITSKIWRDSKKGKAWKKKYNKNQKRLKNG